LCTYGGVTQTANREAKVAHWWPKYFYCIEIRTVSVFVPLYFLEFLTNGNESDSYHRNWIR
jgi:hypothetical protein